MPHIHTPQLGARVTPNPALAHAAPQLRDARTLIPCLPGKSHSPFRVPLRPLIRLQCTSLPSAPRPQGAPLHPCLASGCPGALEHACPSWATGWHPAQGVPRDQAQRPPCWGVPSGVEEFREGTKSQDVGAVREGFWRRQHSGPREGKQLAEGERERDGRPAGEGRLSPRPGCSEQPPF